MTENFVRIDGWVTPRAEKILRRAIAIATERGYNYLGVEHLAVEASASNSATDRSPPPEFPWL